jgi:hypothetical protein
MKLFLAFLRRELAPVLSHPGFKCGATRALIPRFPL